MIDRNWYVFIKLILNTYDDELLGITDPLQLQFIDTLNWVLRENPGIPHCSDFFKNEAISGIFHHGWSSEAAYFQSQDWLQYKGQLLDHKDFYLRRPTVSTSRHY